MNARGLLWWTDGRYVPMNDVKKLGVRFAVKRIDGKKEVEVPFDIEWIRDGLVLVAPQGSLPSCAHYRFSGTVGDFPATAIYRDGKKEPVSVRAVEATVSSARLLPQGLAPRLELGKHTVRMFVELPGTGQVFKTSASFDLDCES